MQPQLSPEISKKLAAIKTGQASLDATAEQLAVQLKNFAAGAKDQTMITNAVTALIDMVDDLVDAVDSSNQNVARLAQAVASAANKPAPTVRPNIQVAPAPVKVDVPPVNIKPIADALAALSDKFKNQQPSLEIDNTEIISRLDQMVEHLGVLTSRLPIIPPGGAGASEGSSGGLTDAELRASPVPVSTDGLTDAELRATAVPVSIDGDNVGLVLEAGGNIEAIAASLDSINTIINNQQTDALTDTELRATPVPVSGTVTANLSAIDNGVLDQIELNQDAQTAILTTMDADTGGILTAIQLLDDTIFTDDNAFTPASSKVSAIGLLADETSPDSVNEGDAGIPRMTLDRMQIVTTRPNATGEGLDIAMNIDVDETEDAVKATAGKLYGWYMYNDGADEVYVKFYNATTANVTVGSTVPVLTIPLPAGAAANVEFTNGIAFSTAITVAATTGVGTADTGAPAANQVIVNSLYK